MEAIAILLAAVWIGWKIDELSTNIRSAIEDGYDVIAAAIEEDTDEPA